MKDHFFLERGFGGSYTWPSLERRSSLRQRGAKKTIFAKFGLMLLLSSSWATSNRLRVLVCCGSVAACGLCNFCSNSCDKTRIFALFARSSTFYFTYNLSLFYTS
jgi:hypothetical protein